MSDLSVFGIRSFRRAGATVRRTAAAPIGPSAPIVTLRDLRHQLWVDIHGKEVQSAATYSYTWLADQFGHICLGLLGQFFFTLCWGLWIYTRPAIVGGQGLRGILSAALETPYDAGMIPGLLTTIVLAFVIEVWAYVSAASKATGKFPLDKKLLAENAITAALYMVLGAVLGLAFHMAFVPAFPITASVVIAAIVCAPDWLRQKIIWQKAAIPYLSRLADTAPTLSTGDSEALQSLINGGAPPGPTPRQVVIGGPIGSGRSALAAGIGTEFAFRNNKVRYLSFDALLEFAVTAPTPPYHDDQGPKNIRYWPWSQAQVVIIDDIGPLIGTLTPARQANLARFTALLAKDLRAIAPVLAQCHTVWVIGDLTPSAGRGKLPAMLDDFAKAIGKFCNSQREVLVIELGPPPAGGARNGELSTVDVLHVYPVAVDAA